MTSNFVCYFCNKQFAYAKSSKIFLFDKKDDLQMVCKFCGKKLDSDNFELIFSEINNLPEWYKERSFLNKIFYQIKKKIRRKDNA